MLCYVMSGCEVEKLVTIQNDDLYCTVFNFYVGNHIYR
jgi:hypothetical protein